MRSHFIFLCLIPLPCQGLITGWYSIAYCLLSGDVTQLTLYLSTFLTVVSHTLRILQQTSCEHYLRCMKGDTHACVAARHRKDGRSFDSPPTVQIVHQYGSHCTPPRAKLHNYTPPRILLHLTCKWPGLWVRINSCTPLLPSLLFQMATPPR